MQDQGLSLLDIGPLSEDVVIREGVAPLRVWGVSAKGIFEIFRRFPEVGTWFKGGKLDFKMLVDQAPDAMASAIAAGCGYNGNAEAEKNAARLPVEAQLDILEAIGRLTFKSGFGPFVQRIVALSEQAASLNYGRASVMTSPPESNPASTADTTPQASGT